MTDPTTPARECAAPGCSVDLDSIGKRATARTCSAACRQAAKRGRAVVAADAQGDAYRCGAPHGSATLERRASAKVERHGRRHQPYGSSRYRRREVAVPVRCELTPGHGPDKPHSARPDRQGRLTWTDAECGPDPADVAGLRLRARLLEGEGLEELRELPPKGWALIIYAQRHREALGAHVSREERNAARWLESLGVLELEGDSWAKLAPRWCEGWTPPAPPPGPSARELAALVNAKHGEGAVVVASDVDPTLRRSSPVIRGEEPFAAGRKPKPCAWHPDRPAVAELSPSDVDTWHSACEECDRDRLELSAAHLPGARRTPRRAPANRTRLEDLTVHQRAGLLMGSRFMAESDRPRHRHAVGAEAWGRAPTRAVLERRGLIESHRQGFRPTKHGAKLAAELRAAWLEADETDPIHAALSRLPLPPSGPVTGTPEWWAERRAAFVAGVTVARLERGREEHPKPRFLAVYSAADYSFGEEDLELCRGELERLHPGWEFRSRKAGHGLRLMAKPRPGAFAAHHRAAPVAGMAADV